MYNEEVNDLLEPANRKLAIKEDPEEGVKVWSARYLNPGCKKPGFIGCVTP
jgi:hypothetical protein